MKLHHIAKIVIMASFPGMKKEIMAKVYLHFQPTFEAIIVINGYYE